MATFSFEDFVHDPSTQISTISNARKDDLKVLARHFKILITSSMTKSKVKKAVILGLIDQGLVGDEATHFIDSEVMNSDVASVQIELAQIELQRDRMRYDLNCREAEARKAETDRAHELAMLRAQAELGVRPARNVSDFDLAKLSKLVPPFNESDPDS